MKFLGLDFETAYDRKTKFSLTNMTAESYIRDPRFEIIGVAFGYIGEEPKWYSGSLEYIRSILQPLPWHDIFVIGHNLSLFDALILTEICGVRPAHYGCTLQLARRLHGGKTADGKNLSNALGALAQMYGLSVEKGNEVHTADGKWLKDFSPYDLAAYGRYCCKDTILTCELWQKLAPQFPKIELFIASLVTKMWAEPRILLDRELLHAMHDEMALRKRELMLNVADTLGIGSTMTEAERIFHVKKQLGSNVKFAELLTSYGVPIPMKRSPKQRDEDGKAKLVPAFAKTDEGMVALTEYDESEDENFNLCIQTLATARIGTKSTNAESRVDSLWEVSQRGLLPVPYLYGKSHCDRLSGTQGINMQNLNRTKPITPRTPNGSLIMTQGGWSTLHKRRLGKDKANRTVVTAVLDAQGREWNTDPRNKALGVQAHAVGLRDTITAPPGYKLVVADSSNVELRTCHALCKQEDSIELLRAGGDLYCDFSTSFYGRTITKEDEDERQHGKVAELLLQFQGGAESFRKTARIQAGVRLTELEAQTTVDVYRAKRSAIKQKWYDGQKAIPKMAAGGGFYLDDWGFCFVEHNAIRLPNGMRMQYHNLRQEILLNYDGLEELSWVYDDKETRKMKKLYGGKVIQNCTQILARIIVFEQKARIERRIGTYERKGEGVVMSTHDEVGALVREDRAEEVEALMLEEMSQSPKWWPYIPVKAESGIGDRYSDCK